MIKEFTIDRRIWVRGGTSEGRGHSSLKNTEGNLCCLGHYAHACGVSESKLLNITTPITLYRHINDFPEEMEWLLSPVDPTRPVEHNSTSCERLMTINDARIETNKTREQADLTAREPRIAKVFAEHGIKVTFTN